MVDKSPLATGKPLFEITPDVRAKLDEVKALIPILERQTAELEKLGYSNPKAKERLEWAKKTLEVLEAKI
jgi:chromosome segregation ATPase